MTTSRQPYADDHILVNTLLTEEHVTIALLDRRAPLAPIGRHEPLPPPQDDAAADRTPPAPTRTDSSQETAMTTSFAPTTLSHLRRLLDERRHRATHLMTIGRNDADAAIFDLDISDLLDSDAPDGGTGGTDRAQALRLTQAAAATANEVDDALRRLEDHRYGICESCDQRIPVARLRALPEATKCVSCKEAPPPLLVLTGNTR